MSDASELPYVNEMVLIHRVIRREVTLAPQLVRSAPEGDLARATVLSEHLGFLMSGLSLHHSGEDELLWPLLLQRAKPDAGTVERMQKQHDEVAQATERVTALIPAWQASAGATERDALADATEQLGTVLFVHLDDEERNILPLVTEHITAAEWNELGEQGLAATPKNRLLIQLGGILEDADPEERAEFLRKIPGFARLLYAVVGRPQYRRYVKKIRGS